MQQLLQIPNEEETPSFGTNSLSVPNTATGTAQHSREPGHNRTGALAGLVSERSPETLAPITSH